MSANNMAMVMQALMNAGLNDNQARILAAEIGRENAFKDDYLWGYHNDPKNGKINVGIISWQGNRGKGVESALKNAGLLNNGKITRGQASLDVMAKYLVDEIRNDPKFSSTKKYFLDNPNVDYQTGAKVLGTNFIRWRYTDPKYASGHRNRDKYYAQLANISAPSGSEMLAQNTPTFQNYTAPLMLPTQVANPVESLTQNILGLDFDLVSALNGFNTDNKNSVASSTPMYNSLLPDIKL